MALPDANAEAKQDNSHMGECLWLLTSNFLFNPTNRQKQLHKYKQAAGNKQRRSTNLDIEGDYLFLLPIQNCTARLAKTLLIGGVNCY